MGSKSTPAPTQAYQVPAQPTLTSTTREQIDLAPETLAARREFDPQFNQLDYEQLEKYMPMLNDLMQQEQMRMSPNQYALNEALAGQALEGSTASLPPLLQQQALDTFRSEIGSNIGSPIGAEYTSRNLAALGEQYRNNYQNMGLSLLNKFPTTPQSPNLQGAQGLNQQSLQSAYGTNVQGYGMYQNALANSYYQPAPSSSGLNTGGMLAGAGAGALAGSVVPGIGTVAGGIIGGLGGSMF